MAPKRAAGSKATAKGKAKPQQKATPAAAAASKASLSTADVDAASLDSAAESKRRRLGRRDSDDQVERVIQNKLGHFTPEVVESAVSSDGESVRDYVKRNMKAMTNRRLGSRFWCEFFTVFPLNKTPAEVLDVPEGEEPVSEELIAAMSAALCDNPATRSIEPLELLLVHCEPLNGTELVGLLRSAMEGPVVTSANSQRMLLSILAYFARLSLTKMAIWLLNVEMQLNASSG